jgi:signal transduction histidine kinase/DNA-binding response OmpR family regulator
MHSSGIRIGARIDALLIAAVAAMCGPGIDCACGAERGSPPVAAYNVQEFGAAHLTTDVAQLPDGRIVAANMIGLLSFDGVRWRVHRHPQEKGGMEHLSIAPDLRIFTSFNGDVGYFRRDAAGSLQWHSLAHLIPLSARTLDAVNAVHYDAVRRGLWVGTATHVFFFSDDASEAQVIGPLDQVLNTLFAGADFLVQQENPVRVSRIDAEHRFALRLVPLDSAEQDIGKLMQATRELEAPTIAAVDGRLLRYRAQRLHLLNDSLRPMFSPIGARAILSLRDGRLMMGSLTHGILILDHDGNLLDRFDTRDGVSDTRRVHGLFEDADGDVWVAQDSGILQIGVGRSVTQFDESHGMTQTAALARWQGQLYAATTTGLMRLVPQSGPGSSHFERVVPELAQLRALEALSDQTLLASSGDLFAIRSDTGQRLIAEKIVDLAGTEAMVRSRFQARRVWLAHAGGILRIDEGARGEITTAAVPDLSSAFYKIAEQDAQTLWIADRVDGVLSVDVEGRRPPKAYGEAQGLPAGQVRIYPGAHRPWFATMRGLRVYDPKSDRFVTPPGLPPELMKDRLFAVLEDADGSLWVRGGEIENDVFWREAGGWRADHGWLHALKPNPTIFGFYRDGDAMWALRANGVMRFDLSSYRGMPATVAPILTAVVDTRSKANLEMDALSALGADRRDLRFEFALPALNRAEANQYRSRLKGFDSDWSDWALLEGSSRVYTNLPDGRFQFEMQARDSALRVSQSSSRTIVVAPPWWRSAVARLAYIGLLALGLWLAARWGAKRRQQQMMVRQLQLQDIVAQRTEELQKSNLQLAEQAIRLTEADRLKTRFFVNVGHEFRTPLTLVLGPIDDLLHDARERMSEHAREKLQMANRNARRILDLVVELLDVNRFEQGQMRLAPVAVDLSILAQRVLQEHAALLQQHGHHARCIVPDAGNWMASVDPPHFERVLSNLISNAAKYMARDGQIELHLHDCGDQIEIALSDQGRGIAADALPHVFDRFYQVEGADSASGYGIGLSLVHEIIQAHGGSIEVESTPGVGSTFRIRVPALPAMPASAAAAAADGGEASPAQASPHEDGAAVPAPPTVERSRPLILVVDDHDDLRARACALLQDRFDVIDAGDGPSAWGLVRDRLPDLLVSDVMMPGFDGVELCRRIRGNAETAAIAVLLLTAKAGSEHAAAGLNAGADDYLAKPFDASELLARIDAMLARAHRLRLRLARTAQQLPVAALAESAEERWRQRLDQAIARHLGDSDFNVEQLAEQMFVDRSQLFRKCKELFALSPSEYLRDTRLARAHELLLAHIGTVSEVAYAVGFDSLSSFTRAFRARYGKAPSHVAKRQA